MHHEPESTDPTTHQLPDDVEAHHLAGKKVPPGPDVEAHVKIVGRPPIVDDVQAHSRRRGAPSEDAETEGEGA